MNKLITVLFHPFSFLLLGIFLLFNTNTYINFSYAQQDKLIIYIVLFVNTMVLPVFFSWYLLSKGMIANITMDDIRDRKLIYFFNFLLYLVTLFVLSGFHVPAQVYKFTFGATLTIGLLFICSLLRLKMSAHLAALGGLTGVLVMLSIQLQTDFLNLICVLFLLSGIVAISRLNLKAHKENEIYFGFLIGFFSQVIVFY